MDFDVAVLGAGIHGCGAALVAASAGRRVIVVEPRGIANQTSRWSSKLIHGGLRYLENFEFRLVREALHERERLCRVAPGLVERVPFIVPVNGQSSRHPLTIRAGLSLYALLGGLGSNVRFRSLPRKDWDDLDGLSTEGLRAVFHYWDAKTDDAALTRSVASAAARRGAEFRIPARFIAGRRLQDAYEIAIDGESGFETLKVGGVVDATGPWITETRAAVEPDLRPVPIDLVQGAHVVVPGTLDKGVYYFESPRGRPMFAIPYQGNTLVGTTETEFPLERDGRSSPKPTVEEYEELREGFTTQFPDRRFEIIDEFAGLRVLPRAEGTFNRRKRETQFVADGAAPHRWVSIVGGKLTTFLPAAVRALRVLEPALGPATRKENPFEIRLLPSAEPVNGDARQHR